MKNKKLIALSVMAIAVSCVFSACGFGKNDTDDQVVVVETPTPAPTIAPAATATPVPQTTTYTASDKSISITLPDSSWSNKMDEGDMQSFESTEGDRILILHGQGEDAMSESVFPDSKDNAIALTASSDVVEGTDFTIDNYQAQKINGIDVYSYTVKYASTDKGDGYTAVENCVIVGQDEFYSLAGSVKSDSALAGVQKSIKSFKILSDDSTLKEVTAGTVTDTANAGEDADQNTDASDDTDSSSQGTDSYVEDDYTGSSSAGGSYDNGTGMDLYTDDGTAFYIYQDADGNWVDGDGNTFTFDDSGVAYDQYGYSYGQGSTYYSSDSGEYYDDSADYTTGSDETYTEDYSNDYAASGSMDLHTDDGTAFGIYQDANGNWIDGDGQTFTFDENGVAYDQYGNAYTQ